LRILMTSMYLRASVDSIYPLLLEVLPVQTRLITTLALGLFIYVVSFPKSLAAKQVICTTWLSIILYTAWLAAALYNHMTGTVMPSPMLVQHGVLWNGTTSIAFSFATSLTVPLSASLAGRPSTPPSHKTSRWTYFQMLSILSTVIATLLILPSILTASSPNVPGALSDTRNIIVHVLGASSLLLSIPSVLVSTPPLPVPLAVRRVCKLDLSKTAFILVVVLLSLAPPSIATFLNDLTLSLALGGTYLLPAWAHITIHYFRRPISIVIPHSVPNTPQTIHSPTPSHSPDALLQRKERLLQRRRLGRRVLWDVGVWLLLIPISVFGMVWAGGRLVGKW
jgi:phosphatidylglycerophosphate synthase